jgi:NADP-dependent 3-hydroxy acid dehydrogenase YdfG
MDFLVRFMMARYRCLIFIFHDYFLVSDIREYGIKVCSIMPGFVNTPMIQDEDHKLNFDKCIQSEDIAEGVLYVLRTPYNVCPTEIKYRPQYTPYLK